MKQQVIFDGRMQDAETPVLTAASRGLRYGYGCFETLRISRGKICLREGHFGRLLSSIDTLRLELPEDFQITTFGEQLLELAGNNGHQESARVRINFFAGEGGLYEPRPFGCHYLVETAALDESQAGFNKEGLVLDVFPDARKAADHYSHIKHNNFLPYALAARWALDHQLDDAILLNCQDRVVDTTIANIFIVQNGIIKTPVLTEGCVSGVMRKYLINSCRKEGIPVEESQIDAGDLLQASEVFLTNALRGIRWVQQVGEAAYTCQVSKLLQRKFIQPLWC